MRKQNLERLIFILGLVNVLVWGFVLWPQTPALVVTFLDVGEGDSAFIKFPHAGNMLIDGGPGGRYNSGEKVIIPFLRQRGIKKIDVIALTHAHADHVAGLIPVIEKMKVSLIVESGTPHTSFLYQRFLEVVQNKDIPFHIAHEGEEVTGFKGVRLLVLNPPLKPGAIEDKSLLNNNSLVIKLTFNEIDFLFCADIEREAEERLVSYGNLLASEIMKIPHHGSSTSIYGPFLNLVQPEVGIINCGFKNPYGHPHPAALKTYEKLNTRIYRTDRSGAIIVTSDGKNYRVKETKKIFRKYI